VAVSCLLGFLEMCLGVLSFTDGEVLFGRAKKMVDCQCLRWRKWIVTKKAHAYGILVPPHFSSLGK
jgi:hypothetical protein